MNQIDTLVQGFLKAARGEKAAALVIYGVAERGKPVLRVASNSDEKGTQAILSWMTKIDDRAIEAAARAVHDTKFMGNHQLDHCCLCGSNSSWENITKEAQRLHDSVARVVLEAAKEQAGKTLNEQTKPELVV